MYYKRKNVTTKMSEVDKLLTWSTKVIKSSLLDNDFVSIDLALLLGENPRQLKRINSTAIECTFELQHQSSANIIPGVLRSLFSI